MTLTLEIAPEIEAALEEAARANGQTLSAFAASQLAEVARTARGTVKARPRRMASGFGKFAGLGVTVEKVHATKQEDIEIEEQREAQRNAQRGTS